MVTKNKKFAVWIILCLLFPWMNFAHLSAAPFSPLIKVSPQCPPMAGVRGWIPPHDSVKVIFQTEKGDIELVLFTRQAPVTSANFLKYVESLGEYGGTFYRTVKPDNQPDKKVKIEVIQGGFDLSSIDTSSIKPIPLERTNATGLSHTNGTLSMARSDPDSGTTEFFICVGDQPSLDFGGARNPDGQGFAAFGRVIRGMDVVRAIQQSAAEGQALVPAVRIIRIFTSSQP
jgi:peptidyl-prolyl cis-trans isomerase A (cyclophilin A)